MLEKNLRVIYMLNGLITVAELVEGGSQPQIKSALALAPGQQPGQMQFMDAFPFTDPDESVTLQKGTFVAITNVGDRKLVSAYEDALTKMKAQKSGIVLP